MDDSMKGRRGMSIVSDPDVTRIEQPQTAGARRSVHLPLRLLLVSDLAPQAPAQDWAASSLIESVDRNSFGEFFARLAPRMHLEVPNEISDNPKDLEIDLRFASLDDFEPERIAQQVPGVSQLIDTRKIVHRLKSERLAPEAFREQIEKAGLDREWADQLYTALSAPEPPAKPAASRKSEPRGGDAVERLLGMVNLGDGVDERESSDFEDRAGGSGFLGALVQAVTGSEDPAPRVERSVADVFIADLDDLIGRQVAAVTEHAAFRRLEAAWRSLKLIVSRIDFRQDIQLDVLPVRKEDLAEAIYYQVLLPEHSDDATQAPLSAVVLDFTFGHEDADVSLLEDLAETGASLQVPIIGSVDAAFFGVKEAAGLRRLPSLRHHLQGPQYIAWNKLRERDESRHLAMVVPPFVLRSAADEGSAADGSGQRSAEPLWGNGSIAVAVLIANSFARTGWPTHIRGNGDTRIGDLPVWASAGGHIPLAALLSDQKQGELADSGFVVLGCRPNHDAAFVAYAPSVRRAEAYGSADEPDEIRTQLSLPGQLFVARAAHFLLAFQRELSSGARVSDVQTELSSRLRTLLSAGGGADSGDSVQVGRITDEQQPEHDVLEVRLRPPSAVLNEPLNLVMRLMVTR